jgi:hypothetical protein
MGGSPGVCVQGLKFGEQMLYRLNHIPSTFLLCLYLFFSNSLKLFAPGWPQTIILLPKPPTQLGLQLCVHHHTWIVCWDTGCLTNFLSGLASNCYHPDLCLLSHVQVSLVFKSNKFYLTHKNGLFLMYNVRPFRIGTMNPPVQLIYANKNEEKWITSKNSFHINFMLLISHHNQYFPLTLVMLHYTVF